MLYLALTSLIFLAAVFALSLQFGSISMIEALPYSIILLTGVQCVIFGLLSFLGVGFNGIIAIVVNGCVSVGCTLSIIRRRKRTPDKPSPDVIRDGECGFAIKGLRIAVGSKADIIALVTSIVFIGFLAIMHYGPTLALAFSTGDSATHFSTMAQLAEGGISKAQYLFAITGASLIDAMRFIVDPVDYSKLYVVNELLWCWLSMQMFYTVITALTKRMNAVIRIGLCLLFDFGYPFYSAVMGWGYYGASMAVVCAIFFTLAYFPLERFISAAALAILLTELSVGYLLLVPPVFLSAFIVVLCHNSLKGGVAKGMGISMLVLLLPCIFTLLLTYNVYFPIGGSGSLGSSTDAVLKAISSDGGNLKNMYPNFIFVAPLALYGFICKLKLSKESISIEAFPIIFLFYTIVLFGLCLVSVVTPYYFYKTYGVLWMLFFAFAAIGIDSLLGISVKALFSYCFIWFLLLGLSLSSLDAKLAEKRPNVNPTPITDSLFPIYRFNIDTSRSLVFDIRSLSELREETSLYDEDNTAALLGENEARWFSTLGFDGKPIAWWEDHDRSLMLDSKTILDAINDAEYVYIDNTYYTARPYVGSDYSSLDETAQYIKDNYVETFETDYGTMYKKR